jgi:hypothetical protein
MFIQSALSAKARKPPENSTFSGARLLDPLFLITKEASRAAVAQAAQAGLVPPAA